MPEDPSHDDSAARRATRELDSLIETAQQAERAGDWDRALEKYEAAFACLPEQGDARVAASVVRWIGTVHRQRGDLDLAHDLYEAGLAIARAAGLPSDEAAALNCLAVNTQFRGDTAEAERIYVEARDLADALGDRWLAAAIDQNLGTLANVRGDIARALSRYRSALDRLGELGARVPAASVLNNMGMAHVDVGDWEAAEACLDEAYRLAETERDAGTLGSIELNRAELFLERHAFETARECCDRAFEIFSRVESDSGIAEVLKLYGVLHRETGRTHLAEAHLGRARDLSEGCGDLLLQAEVSAELGELHRAHGRNRDALQSLNRAHTLFTELGARREILDLERRLDQLQSAFLRVVRQWAESIESKDRYTAGHCERVADYSCMLAEVVGITGRDLAWFRMGAFLHDVGKVAVPSEILNKPGPLTAEEFEAMKRHTVVGDEIVAGLGFPWDIGPMVRNHHEHWDGTGYPDGLAGEAIPRTARILCVADVYDALTTERSYRHALPREEALRIMQAEAGALLDPDLFETFRPLVEDGAARAPAIA